MWQGKAFFLPKTTVHNTDITFMNAYMLNNRETNLMKQNYIIHKESKTETQQLRHKYTHPV